MELTYAALLYFKSPAFLALTRANTGPRVMWTLLSMLRLPFVKER